MQWSKSDSHIWKTQTILLIFYFPNSVYAYCKTKFQFCDYFYLWVVSLEPNCHGAAYHDTLKTTEDLWLPGATDFLRTEGMVQGVSCLSLLTLLRRLHKVSFCAEHLAKEQSLPSFNSWVWRGQSTSKIRTHDLPDTKRRL